MLSAATKADSPVNTSSTQKAIPAPMKFNEASDESKSNTGPHAGGVTAADTPLWCL